MKMIRMIFLIFLFIQTNCFTITFSSSIKNNNFFIKNKMQLTDVSNKICRDVLFYCEKNSNILYLLNDRLSFVSYFREDLPNSKTISTQELTNSVSSYRMDLLFQDCNKDIQIVPDEESEPTFNYYLGHIQQGIVNIKSCKTVTYKNLYEHIDLVVSFSDSNFQFRFVFSPGAKIGDVKLKFEGNNPINQVSRNDIKVINPKFEILNKIISSNIVDKSGKITENLSSYFTSDENNLYYSCSDYTGNNLLEIITKIDWITFLGGSGLDMNRSVRTDSNNDVIITGFTRSNNFPITTGAFQSTNNGDIDAILTKFDSKGKLIWSTYFGGNGQDGSLALSVTKNNEYWICGDTRSSNLPVTSTAFQPANKGGTADAWMAKFSIDGRLLFASYAGSGAYDVFTCTDVDKNNNAWFYGDACGDDFPFTNDAYQKIKQGNYDAVLMKLSASGVLLYSSYYGGNADEFGMAFSLDNKDFPVISGFTASTNLPVTPDAYKNSISGQSDAFLMKLDASYKPIYCSYFGGSDWDECTNMNIDINNNIILRGTTASTDLPCSGNVFQKNNKGMVDFFVAKFDQNCKFKWCTYFGGSLNEDVVWIDFHSGGISSDSKGNIALSGVTESKDILTTSDAISSTLSGKSDAVIAVFDDAGNIIYSTYLGGSNLDVGYDLTFDYQDNLYTVGTTNSIDFPVTSGAFQTHEGGVYDGYIVKFGITSSKKVSITGNDVLCEGDTLTLKADSGFVSYQWYENTSGLLSLETKINIKVTKPGEYYVKAKEANGSESTSDVVSVTFHSRPAPIISAITLPCKGRSGTLGLSKKYVSYSWSTGETTSSIKAPQPGKYSVTVVDSNGCVGFTEIIVDESVTAKINLSLTGGPTYCIGDTVELTAETGHINYEWYEDSEGILPNENKSKIRVTKPGKYYVKALTADSCETASDSIIVKYNPLPVPEIDVLLQPCNGRPGRISLVGNYLFWRWSTGETSTTISAPTAGEYSVTVVDSNGCTGVTKVIVKENFVYVTVTGKIPICFGDTVILTAETGFISYQWYMNSTEIPENQRLIKVTKPGNYFVRAVTADSCIAVSDVFTVYFYPQPIVTIDVMLQPCDGRPGILNLSGNFSSWRWSTKESSRSIFVSKAGKYSVQVVDSNGCSGYAEVMVDETVLEKIKVSLTGRTYLCNADSVELTAESGFLDYEWYEIPDIKLPNGNQEKIKITKSGKYFVKGRTKDSCMTSSVPVDVSIEPSVDILSFEGFSRDSIIDFDSTWYQNIVCRYLKIRNNGARDYILKNILLRYNINFSVPQSQFDLLIPANSERDLIVCITPLNIGNLFDTLFIPDVCTYHTVPLKAFCLGNIYEGNSLCNQSVTASTAKLPPKNSLTTGFPYPNPAIQTVFVPYEIYTSKEISAEPVAVLSDLLGIHSEMAEKEVLTFERQNETIFESGRFSFDVSKLSRGIYIIKINFNNETKAYTIVIAN